MYTIGAFARLAGVSVRTLRHYDAVELLHPAEVDPSTGYRRYRAQQLPRLNRIVALKELGLSLAEIRPLLDLGVSADSLAHRLAEQRAVLVCTIESELARLARVEHRLRDIQLEDDMSIDMRIKPIPAMRVAQIAHHGNQGVDFSDLTGFVRPAIAQLEAALRRQRTPYGKTFLHYRQRADGRVDPRLAYPIGDEPFEPSGEIEVVVLPAIDAVVTIHDGAAEHDLIGPLYAQMAQFAETHGRCASGPGRDHFIDGSSGHYVMELQLPLAPKPADG